MSVTCLPNQGGSHPISPPIQLQGYPLSAIIPFDLDHKLFPVIPGPPVVDRVDLFHFSLKSDTPFVYMFSCMGQFGYWVH
jgi:hypothetical protein